VTDSEIDRALATIGATLNDRGLTEYDTDQVQELVTSTLGGEELLRVDEGGGVHEADGPRVGAIRRTSSGEWIVERQDRTAAHSDAPIPTPPKKRSCESSCLDCRP
jgi:hypothetical protein